MDNTITPEKIKAAMTDDAIIIEAEAKAEATNATREQLREYLKNKIALDKARLKARDEAMDKAVREGMSEDEIEATLMSWTQELTSTEQFDKHFFVIRDYFGKCKIGWEDVRVNPRTKGKIYTLHTNELL